MNQLWEIIARFYKRISTFSGKFYGFWSLISGSMAIITAFVAISAYQLTKVPNVENLSASEANALLEGKGYEVRYKFRRETQKEHHGKVLSQNPLAGEHVLTNKMILEVGVLPRNLIAYFPLGGNLNDSTGTTRMTEIGATFSENSLYLNGEYDDGMKGETGYQVIVELDRSKFDYDDFTVSLDFKLEEFLSPRNTILAGGVLSRWFIIRSKNGNLTLTFNNNKIDKPIDLNHEDLLMNKWYRVICSVDVKGKSVLTLVRSLELENFPELTNIVENRLDDVFVFDVTKTEYRETDKKLTFTDYSSGNVFKGWVRNIRVFARSMLLEEMKFLDKKWSAWVPDE